MAIILLFLKKLYYFTSIIYTFIIIKILKRIMLYYFLGCNTRYKLKSSPVELQTWQEA